MTKGFKGTISELGKASGLPIETIRFYQRRGILEIPKTNGRERRHYTEEALERLAYIRSAKALGFTLKEISDALAMRKKTGRACCEVRNLVDTKLEDVRKQIAALREVETQLVKIAKSCSGKTRSFDVCEILEKMAPATSESCWEVCEGGRSGKCNGEAG